MLIYSPTPRLPSIDVDVSGSIGAKDEIDTISVKPQLCDKDEKDMTQKCQPSSNIPSLVKSTAITTPCNKTIINFSTAKFPNKNHVIINFDNLFEPSQGSHIVPGESNAMKYHMDIAV